MILLDSTASAEGPALTGEKAAGDGAYGARDGDHTVAYFVNNFVGVIEIQATLAADPLEEDWFSIPATQYGDGSTILNTPVYRTFVGNFSWVRVKVSQFSSGAINKIGYQR